MLRILIVDDSPSDRFLAIHELKKAFALLEVEEVGTDKEFTLALQKEEFNLVITDYQLHWSNGLEIFKLIQSRYPYCPVVMFTNSGSEEIAVEGMKQGLSDYVLKGKRLHRLSVAVRESLHKAEIRKEYEQTLERLRASEERLQRQAEELTKANRLKDEFLAVLSHELRTPLNPILGWVQMLRKGNLNPTRVDRALETIESNVRLQARLVEDLLDISRILRGGLYFDRALVDLVLIIEAALEVISLQAKEKHLKIETELRPRGRFVLGDSGRLQQIVSNLLSNAVKFTPEGGTIEVRLDYIGSSARITVKDTGKGITPEFLPHVFDNFRQEDGSTTRKFGGLGLGLAIVRHLSELHGGTVKAESPGPGKGATFTIELPLVGSAARIVEAGSQTNELLELQGVKVMVVDDEKDNLDLIVFALENEGAIVVAATSAREALEGFLQFKPDVLVSDIAMPEMDGYALLGDIRAFSSEFERKIPAIALSAYAEENHQQRAISAGFQAYLPKPIEPSELVKAIVGLLTSFN